MDVREFFVRLVRYVILVLWGTAALAGTIDPDIADEKYVEFGKKFPYVRKIRARARNPVNAPENAIVTWHASAVAIRPHWVITAAHVLDGVTGPAVLGDEETPTEYSLNHTILHEKFDQGRNGYYDIALGYSKKDLGLEFYPKLYTDHDELGKDATLAGFGFTGTFQTGIKVSDGRRRAGTNKVSSLERSVLVCDPSMYKKTVLEFLITPGDSGGGLFIDSKLAGIHSFLMAADGKPDGTYTDESAHTRVSLYVDWVESEIKKYEETLEITPTP
jgi:hypothetical protein